MSKLRKEISGFLMDSIDGEFKPEMFGDVSIDERNLEENNFKTSSKKFSIEISNQFQQTKEKTLPAKKNLTG